MKILITGAKGFIGKNLISELRNRKYTDLYEYDRQSDPRLLDIYAKDCDFVFHLAGINRPENPAEFMLGNYGLTSTLLDALKKHENTCPVMMSSSTQAELMNPYGISKKAGEDLLINHNREIKSKILIYRFPNVFGKWCKPNYNSVIATFSHNISRDLPIQINDRDNVLNLVYIDDVVEELIRCLEGNESQINTYYSLPIVYTVSLGRIVDLLYKFRDSRKTLNLPNMSDDFEKKLYSTYLSYLPINAFCYPLKMNVDERGSFTEIIRTVDRGQFSVNITKPGITKGNHWHHTKNEKFLVVGGKGLIRFRRIDSDEVIEYAVSDDTLEVVDIPTGYTHNIMNVDDRDLITFMWANEVFDPEKPDTFFLKV